jgi:predicted nucleotidyltransferase
MLTISEIKEKAAPIFAAGGITKATLFGSYMRGEAVDNSDIDIAVETEDWVRGLKFVGVIGRICETLGAEVDLIPRRAIRKGSPLEQEIIDNGMIIYDKN